MTSRPTTTPDTTLAQEKVPHSRIQTTTSQASSGSWCRSPEDAGAERHSPSSAGTGPSNTASMYGVRSSRSRAARSV